MDELKIEEQPKSFTEKLQELQPGESMKHEGLTYIKVDKNTLIVSHGAAMVSVRLGDLTDTINEVLTVLKENIQAVNAPVAAPVQPVAGDQSTTITRKAQGTGTKPRTNKGGKK